MRFTIEICATGKDGAETVLHRTIVSAINPVGARKETHRLLAVWKRRRATSARVLNGHGERLYNWNA